MSIFCLVIINLKLNNILVNKGKRGNEKITMTFLHIRIKKGYLYYADRRIFFYLHRAFHSIL